jgi:hypothetical protein
MRALSEAAFDQVGSALSSMAILADIARLIKGVRDSLFRQSCVPQVPNADHAPKGVSQRAGGDAVIERAKI